MLRAAALIIVTAIAANARGSNGNLPVVINTWFPNAAQLSYDMVLSGFTALDSVEAGCSLCEDIQCDGTVGYGGSVDAFGDVSLDALIMDAETHDVGAVTNLRNVRHAISAARKVLHYSTHTLLSGDGGEEPNNPLTRLWLQPTDPLSCSRQLQPHGATASSSAGGPAAYPPPLPPSADGPPFAAYQHCRKHRCMCGQSRGCGLMGSHTHETATPPPPSPPPPRQTRPGSPIAASPTSTPTSTAATRPAPPTPPSRRRRIRLRPRPRPPPLLLLLPLRQSLTGAAPGPQTLTSPASTTVRRERGITAAGGAP